MNRTAKMVGSIACAVALGYFAAQASGANLITNPGFETGDLTGWTVLGASGAGAVTVTADNGPSAPGSYSAFMTNGAVAANLALQQSTPLGSAIPGQTVDYSFDLKVSSSLNGGVCFIHIWDINSTGGVIDQPPGLLGPYFNSTWATDSGSFTAAPNTDHFEIEFDCTTGAASGSFEAMHVDNVSLSQIPEPSTLALVGLGLFSALFAIRRRQA